MLKASRPPHTLASPVCNAKVDGIIPEDNSKSWLASVYRGKGDNRWKVPDANQNLLLAGSHNQTIEIDHILK